MKKALLTILLSIASAADVSKTTTFDAPELTNGWKYSSNSLTLSDERVSFTVYAKEQNLQKIKDIALTVSDPTSSSYGNYLSTEQLAEITKPKASDVNTIKQWLDTAKDATVTEINDRSFVVELSASSASQLLSTTFQTVVNKKTNQVRTVARDYTVPTEVHLASNIMGLHGLPLPPRTNPVPPNANPATVTPSVIASTYGISGVTPSSSSGNIQAVAEFQGQTMSSKDLSAFFQKYVPNAKKGDDTVSKFVGDPGDKTGQTEASLDNQYIMGVAPGIATEFWLYDPSDFCSDLKNWTSTLLADKNPPLVTSVSYGWQGNLSQIGCKQADVDAVDSDFAKIAAKGLTIIFASGDSGSGYSPSNVQCTSNFADNTELTGTILYVEEVFDVDMCCEFSVGKAWTYDGPDKPSPSPGPTKCPAPSKGISYTGTRAQTLRLPASDGQRICCEFSEQQGAGYSFAPPTNGTSYGTCTVFKTITGQTKATGVLSGQNKPRVQHNCTVFSSVTGTKTSTGKTSSNTNGPSSPVVLWPSWPASSPWVTSVGATRFVGQTVGNDEMATDQFGSGGGFSKQFNQSPNAKWQSADVANYLKIVPKGLPFPPSGSFPPLGRATPDVSALGEGYQVYQSGRVMAVGGTSASAPCFAAVISLLNEHRLQNGKKPLGYLNQWLYLNQDSFTDVTKGTNAIGRGTGPIKYGFNATKGWDPATGLGTPNFKKLLALASQ